ncbi:hypothetical protein LXA43DRAFT_339558 [Ganoderma leucocontextum]|nr:hypothetical protein LXA43DRAFT_339558 [Ganoderma leucocontextum]
MLAQADGRTEGGGGDRPRDEAVFIRRRWKRIPRRLSRLIPPARPDLDRRSSESTLSSPSPSSSPIYAPPSPLHRATVLPSKHSTARERRQGGGRHGRRTHEWMTTSTSGAYVIPAWHHVTACNPAPRSISNASSPSRLPPTASLHTTPRFHERSARRRESPPEAHSGKTRRVYAEGRKGTPPRARWACVEIDAGQAMSLAPLPFRASVSLALRLTRPAMNRAAVRCQWECRVTSVAFIHPMTYGMQTRLYVVYPGKLSCPSPGLLFPPHICTNPSLETQTEM